MGRAPHRTVPATVWALSRLERGIAQHLGIYSSETKGTQEAERLIKQAVGLDVRTRLRLTWQAHETGRLLHYGRDAHDFRFRLEPWPLDGEA